MSRLSPIWGIAPILAGTVGVFGYAVWVGAGEPADLAGAMDWVYNDTSRVRARCPFRAR